MSVHFWIQASCPRWQGSVDPDATTIDEAVESVFTRNTEDALIVRQHVYIPLSYKYDVGTILRDVLQMIRELLGTNAGEWQVDWPSNTFGARWHFKWQEDRLVVTASEWRSVVGDTEELLRKRSILHNILHHGPSMIARFSILRCTALHHALHDAPPRVARYSTNITCV